MSARTRTFSTQLSSNKEERENVRMKNADTAVTLRLRLACGTPAIERTPWPVACWQSPRNVCAKHAIRQMAARNTNFSFDKCGHSNTTDCKSKTYAAHRLTFSFVLPCVCHFGNHLTHCAALTTVRSRQHEIIIMSARTRTNMPQLLSAQEERENVRMKNADTGDTFRRRVTRWRAP